MNHHSASKDAGVQMTVQEFITENKQTPRKKLGDNVPPVVRYADVGKYEITHILHNGFVYPVEKVPLLVATGKIKTNPIAVAEAWAPRLTGETINTARLSTSIHNAILREFEEECGDFPHSPLADADKRMKLRTMVRHFLAEQVMPMYQNILLIAPMLEERVEIDISEL